MENRIPNGWKKVQFGDVVNKVNDKVPNREEWTFDRFIGGQHFDEGEIRITRSAPIEGNEEVIGSAFHMRFKPRQVLYVTRNPRLRKGGMVDFEGVCSNVSFVMEADETQLLQSLLPFIIQTEDFVRHTCNNAHGSTNPFLNYKDIAKYEFLLPPLEEQKKISEVLWSVEGNYNEIKKMIKSFELFRVKTIKEVLIKGPNKDVDLKKSDFGLISKDWQVKKISEVCRVRRGASPRPIGDKKYFSDKGPGWIRIADVTPAYKYLNKTTQYLSDEGVSKSVRVKKGDLIMSICATIGKPVLIDMDACIHDGFVLFSEMDKDILLKEYLFYILLMREKDFITQKQVGTQGNLNTTIVGNTKIVLPSTIEEQKLSLDIFNKLDNELGFYQLNELNLKNLRNKLSNELLSGKLRLVSGK
jgi:type I restriction enzyme, S subunit